MKKKIIFVILILIICTISLVLFIKNKDNKFYLDKEYYDNIGLSDTSIDEVEKLIENKKSFILFTYNDFCNFSIPCDSVFEKAAKANNIKILQIPFKNFKKSSLYKTVKYAPSLIIIHDGKIIDFLDANSDDDYNLYQKEEEVSKWFKKYIKFKE